MRKYCAVILLFLFLFNIVIPGIYTTRVLNAASYDNGSAGNVTITTTRNLSSFSNKNFRNLTIAAGGTLVFDTPSTVYVSEKLTVKSGGKITSSKGTDGYKIYRSDIRDYVPVEAEPGVAVTINANNIEILSNGIITSGIGGKGYDKQDGSSDDMRWSAGSGAQGGNIALNTSYINMDRGIIISGDGGYPGDRGGHYDSARDHNGCGGSSGNVTINSSNFNLKNRSYIKTGIGQDGNTLKVADDGSDKAGDGGDTGDIIVSCSLISIDSSSYIQTGNAGDAGYGYDTKDDKAYGGDGGRAGRITLSNFSTAEIYGKLLGGTGGNGAPHGRTYDNGDLGATAGGYGGGITISSSSGKLILHSTGRFLGGTGGEGGSTYDPQDRLWWAGSGGAGGSGGSVSFNIGTLELKTGSLAKGGKGGRGGDGDRMDYDHDSYGRPSGGTGGAGGSISITVRNAIVKPNQENLVTGNGGDGGDWAGDKSKSKSNSTTNYYYVAGNGGKSGNFSINLPAKISKVNYNLVKIGQGGRGHSIGDIPWNDPRENEPRYSTNYYYTPGAGGNTGNITINAPNLTLSAANVFKFSKPGLGNEFIGHGDVVKSKNGSQGNLSFNITGQFSISSNDAVYFDNSSHSSYVGNNTSNIFINCPRIRFTSPKPIRWTDISGGTLNLKTDLRDIPYKYEDWNNLLKDSGRKIGSYVFDFTYPNFEDLFVNIPEDGYQASTDLSFAIDEEVYNKYLKCLTTANRYYSEDNGINWQEIDVILFNKESSWSCPATLKGNYGIRLGLSLYKPINGVTFKLNGVELGNSPVVPETNKPPLIYSYKYSVLDTDVGAPNVILTVNNGEEITENPVLNINIDAVDNITRPDMLKYQINFANGKGNEKVPYANIKNYSYDLRKYFSGGHVPSGYYKICAKVLDENFNTGLDFKRIYYLRAEDKPEGPASPHGFILNCWNGKNEINTISYEGKTVFISRENVFSLDFRPSRFPYYQVQTGYKNYGPIFPKIEKTKLEFPPGDGLHLLKVRYCNADKIPGLEQDFSIIVDDTPPVVSVTIENGATATRTSSITLLVTARDNMTKEGNIKYSLDKNNWNLLMPEGKVVKDGLKRGLNHITLYVQDNAGNISSASCQIFRL